MFTVIICSKKISDDCVKNYGDFLAPFMSDEVAFCDWNPSANSLDDAVPDLKDIIRNKAKWRALIVLDAESYGEENISKRNPFNYNNSTNKIEELFSADEIIAFRKDWDEKLNRAISNPLVKLGMWLSGAPSTEYPTIESLQYDLPEITDEMYFEELRKKNLSASEVELDYLLAKKSETISRNFVVEGQMDNKPTEIIALSERMYVNENDECNYAWKVSQEHAYSRFYEDNLYSDRLFFITSDICYVNGARKERSYFNFLILIYMLANNDLSSASMRRGKLYSIRLNLDQQRMNNYCCNYLEKLNATLVMIKRLKKRITHLTQEPLDRRMVEDVFISDIHIPVDITDSFDMDKLFCKYDKLGFSRDCPTDEYDYWYNQYRSIEKEFIRYIREPRRAVKTAVKGDFRINKAISDDRATALNEFQCEDVQIRLQEEEEAMIKTRVTHLFKTKEYMDKMEEADRSIRKNIFQRMSKKKTIIVSAIAIAAYAFGFLPSVFSSTNNIKSVGFSFLIVLAILALFALLGFGCIWVFRKRLKDRFVHFNFEMSGILKDIKDGLLEFSRYLSHASNVMREFSVLKNASKEKNEKISIIKKHEFYISNQIEKAQELFYDGIGLEHLNINEQTPYEYDFTKDVEYDYSILSVNKPRSIAFLNAGNMIDISVDYIDSIELKREELYD